MPVTTEYSEPATADVIGGQVETLLMREPGKPADVLLGVSGDDGAAMVTLTADHARELAARLATLADEAV